MINFLTASLSSLAISVFALASAHEPVSRSAPATALVQSAPPSTAPAVVWPTNDSGLKALGETLTKAWFAKIVAKDWAAVEGQLHPSFQRINFEGAFDRAAEIAEIKALAVGAPTFNTFHATRVGEALVVTCMTAVPESLGGSTLPSDSSARLGVWKAFDGVWQLTAWVSLNMPASRPAPTAPRFAGDAAINAQGQALITNFLTLQHDQKLDAFDALLAEGMQVANFKGIVTRADIIKGAKYAKTDAPVIADVRATVAGDLTIVTCNLTMGQKIGWTTIPAASAPYLMVFQSSTTAAGATVSKAIAIGNTNKPV